MTKTARITALTAALTADENAFTAKSWAAEAGVSLSSAKRDMKVAGPLAADARAAAAAGDEKAVKEAARRTAIVAYLSDRGDTINGISNALSIHPRTVRAAILYGKGTVSFRCEGMEGRAKVWTARAEG